MGSYKEIKGDLLDLFYNEKFNIIAHGANCFSTMGTGIALQIKQRYPSAYYADLYDCRHPFQRFGSFSYSETYSETGRPVGGIYNLYTQFEPGPNADITAIRMSLKQMSLDLPEGNLIGLPLIGCGIGGLDWETQVKPIVQEELKDMDVTVVHYDK